MKKYFRPKPIEEFTNKKEESLTRRFDATQLTFLGIGAIIGAGIFVLTGVAASQHAGPAITLSFLLSGFVCICAGLCYAEFASMIPISGSSYTYAYATLGELPAWIIGCMAIMGYFLGSVSVSKGWSGYLVNFLDTIGINLPSKFTNSFGTIINSNGDKAIISVPALIIPIITSLILCKDVNTSSTVNTIIVVIKMVVLATFIIFGFFFIDKNNWIPYIPQNLGSYGEFGYSGIFAGASMVFLAYNGFDAVCTAAQETKNPQKNIPLGIILSISISTITYIMVSAVLTGVVHYSELNVSYPIAIVIRKMNMPWFSYLSNIGAIAALTSVIMVSQYTIVRMLFVMASDKLLPKCFLQIHKKYKTPHILTLATGFATSIVGAFVSLEQIINLSSFAVLSSLTVICIATICMRYKKPTIKRSFKCPGMPILPLFAVFISLQIIFTYPLMTFIQAFICIVLFVLYFFLYKLRNKH